MAASGLLSYFFAQNEQKDEKSCHILNFQFAEFLFFSEFFFFSLSPELKGNSKIHNNKFSENWRHNFALQNVTCKASKTTEIQQY